MITNEIQLYEKEIRKCLLFKDMLSDDLYEMLSSAGVRTMHCKPGMLLDSDYLYVVLNGSIIIEKQASDGRFVTMGVAESGSAVNAASVFLKGSPMSRIAAKAESTLLQINETVLNDRLLRGGIFAINLVKFLSERICFLNKKITSLAGYTATSRLHLYLQENNVNGKVDIPMTMTEFAEFLGVGRASLYRTLDQLQNEGSIERQGKTIVIKAGFKGDI